MAHLPLEFAALLCTVQNIGVYDVTCVLKAASASNHPNVISAMSSLNGSLVVGKESI